MLALLPLVLFYEAAVPFTTLRSGWYHRIDAWSQAALGHIGLTAYYLPGFLILVALLVIHVYRRDPWHVRLDSVWRLWAESLLWTVPLFVLHQLFTLPLGGAVAAGVALDVSAAGPEGLFSNIVLGIGAGLFEEFLFRLVLITAVLIVLQRLLSVPVAAAHLLAVCLVAAVFAAAHHFGPSPRPYSHMAFLLRVGAGIYLGGVYILRGFATCAIVHAAFNVILALVSVA